MSSAKSVDEHAELTVGRISGVYGVKGWLKVFSYTQPKENIFNYSPWRLEHQGQTWVVPLRQGRVHGKGLVAAFEDVDDRDVARKWIGATVKILRSQLPEIEQGEYFWADLIGLDVINLQGEHLGRVTAMMETGANDVLVVKDDQTERLIPFVLNHYVKDVDLESKTLRIDWDKDF